MNSTNEQTAGAESRYIEKRAEPFIDHLITCKECEVNAQTFCVIGSRLLKHGGPDAREFAGYQR